MSAMTLVFLFTGLVAGVLALLTVVLFPPAMGITLPAFISSQISHIDLSSQLVGIFTVSDFSKLLSHEHMLALIVMSILVGLATSPTSTNNQSFFNFLQSGEVVFMRVFSLIMYYAPIGFFAYFAVLVADLGPKLIESYVRVTCLYYGFCLAYFLFVFTGYAYLAGKIQGIKLFWSHVLIPMTTALATCSSAASIPANLAATSKMQVPQDIYETVVPLGSLIHKDGSVIGGVFKIAFLFGIFHMDFTGITVLSMALGVSLLVGTVMGAIPSGGMLGELLILSVYGFPPSALIIIAAISILIDPIATMINVTGNSVSAMMIARWVQRKSSLLLQ